jgi:hypothetical protein
VLIAGVEHSRGGYLLLFRKNIVAKKTISYKPKKA